ncbi:MAG: hypothetical protein ACLP4V_01345, partial [Methylocella sp.]
MAIILALLLVLIVLGSVLFHLLSPWWLTPIASNWGYIDNTIILTFWITGIGYMALVQTFGINATKRSGTLRGSCGENSIPDFGRPVVFDAKLSEFELTFPDPMHEFNAGDGDRGALKALQSEHWT